jgi:hypothetical protein
MCEVQRHSTPENFQFQFGFFCFSQAKIPFWVCTKEKKYNKTGDQGSCMVYGDTGVPNEPKNNQETYFCAPEVPNKPN